ncbi:MAG: amidohydrolase family protein [Chloroflexi bacterium]|nr:amidohydrolase family protein [Chloroflexota bacterium]
MFDVVITGGTIVDGTGKPGVRADVGIQGEFIAAIGDLRDAVARRVVDATGLVVSPGFVDTHTHSEGDLLTDPQHACGLRQGITTEFLGIDGMSYAPLSPKNYKLYRHWLGGLLGNPPEDLDMSSVTAFRANYHKKCSINTAYLVPHATVRLEVLGFHDKPLTGDALKQAKRLVQEGLEQGAVGMSTGGSYYPGPWGTTDEIAELAQVVKDAGKVYMAEPRRADLNRVHKRDGVEEALEVARRTGVKLHLAHFRTDATTAGRVSERMASTDRAKKAGADVSLDIYPYPTGSSIPVSLLPPWAQDGGPKEILKHLKDKTTLKKICDEMEAEELAVAPKDTVFCYLPAYPHRDGATLEEIAAEKGKPLVEAMCEILVENDLKIGYMGAPPDSTKVWRQISQDSMELLARDDYNVCTDITPAGDACHPRSYGAFPRFLGRLRRQFGGISLEGMVHRMTERPAKRFGITKRGRIEKGYFADIAIFDEHKVIDNSTYDDSKRFPSGIPYVVVNGQVAVDNERCTGVLAGQAVP